MFALGEPSIGSTSAFGALGGKDKEVVSGFGSGAGGFGSLAGQPRLSGFGSGSLLGAKPTIEGLDKRKPRPFGAPTDEDEGDSDGEEADGEGNEGEQTQQRDPDKRDDRFFHQDFETGEEKDVTLFSQRAKLFYFTGGEWKERGVGVLKLNTPFDDEESQNDLDEAAKPAGDKPKVFDAPETKLSRKARFIMRADGSHRLILNSPLMTQFPFGGDATGSKPSGSMIVFQGLLEGSDDPRPLRLKVSFQLLKSSRAS